MKILVADDDNLFLQMISDILTEAGHEVIVTKSGRDALELAIVEPPDLVILDIILPELLGTEVTEELRRFKRTDVWRICRC